MKITATIVAATALIAGVNAQQTTSGPLALLQRAASLLTPGCRTTVEGLLRPNSTLFQCLHFEALGPILGNNQTSVIPQINSYLETLCPAPVCTNATIQAATSAVAGNCSQDLQNFGLDTSILKIAMNAIPVAREVACLTTSNSSLVTPAKKANATAPTNGTSYCVISGLAFVQEALELPLSNENIDSLILGKNSTLFNKVVALVNNETFVEKLLCTDCVAAAADIILTHYPTLANTSFSLKNVPILNNLTGINKNASYNAVSFYKRVCNVTVGPNVTVPSSINETAFNTTLPGAKKNSTSVIVGPTSTRIATSTAATVTSTILSSNPVTSSTVAATATATATRAVGKRFVKWE